MLADWYNTIDFDRESEVETAAAVDALGTDGRLRLDVRGDVLHVTMTEKLLVLLLAKLTNLVPEGGIWMNTQRPEWNDANNALVGKGLSVVTAAYLRRFIAFWSVQLAETEVQSFVVSQVVADLLGQVQAVFDNHHADLKTGFSDQSRRAVMDALGAAATTYRTAVYQDEHTSVPTEITGEALCDFLALALAYVEQTLRVNRRPDDLYHAYNILRLEEEGAAVDHLYVMLEGQVAMLSSGMLSAVEVLALLKSMRHSDLYRADQHTYMLYPNRELPGFLEKNVVPAERIASSPLVEALMVDNDERLLVADTSGHYHFNGSFRNATDVTAVLDVMAHEPAYADLVASERDFILDLFETTFNHRAFTGRSGTFFAFEGLGSIYWHMVAKLLLAVEECYMAAAIDGADANTVADLAAAYYDIRQGLGFNKSPAVYGAFPTDPYSHTPLGGGAKQPGMTGQVKEEILTRWGELGVSIHEGALHFAPLLLRQEEFLYEPGNFAYVDTNGQPQAVALPAGSLAFTVCQTPVIYILGDKESIEVSYADGSFETTPGSRLPDEDGQHIMARDNHVQLVRVTLERDKHLS